MDRLSHRKAGAAVRLLKRDGAPLACCPVQVDQISHAFLFGCGAFDAVALSKLEQETGKEAEEKRDRVKSILDKWLKLFNYGTLPFYWGRYEPEEGQTAYRETMAAARFLQSRGVRVKGHPLCWHTVCAPWLLKFDNAEILRRQLSRIRREVTTYRGVVDMWDVINEVVIMPVFNKYDNAVTRICRDRGRLALVRDVFEAARESNPDAVLLINDFDTSPAYEELLSELLDAGIPIGAVGIQSHQHQGYWGMEKLQSVLERFSRFGLPLHFTENTLISGTLMPEYIVDLNDWQVEEWPSTPEGEARQAREMEEMVSALFAHPRVEAITTWDFTDGGWLKAPSGLVRMDGSEKPAYQTLHGLIHGTWETHESLMTDEEGNLSFTGFKGKYRICTPQGAAELDLAEDRSGTLMLDGEKEKSG